MAKRLKKTRDVIALRVFTCHTYYAILFHNKFLNDGFGVCLDFDKIQTWRNRAKVDFLIVG